MGFGFSWEPCDNIRPKGHLRAQAQRLLCEPNGIIAQMSPLHALQN